MTTFYKFISSRSHKFFFITFFTKKEYMSNKNLRNFPLLINPREKKKTKILKSIHGMIAIE